MKLNYFNFKPFGNKVLLTNDFGNYIFLDDSDFKKLIQDKIEPKTTLEENLINAHMIYNESDLEFSNTNRYELRYVKNHLEEATSLHIFVVTTACNMACIYCQANNGKKDSNLYMSKETAEKAVNIALQSPNKCLTFEFQGGEPLLNFETIKYIVEYAEKHKENHVIEYNIVSNLTLLDDEKIKFIKKYNIGISTSIDGNEILHNYNRPFKDGGPTFKRVVNSLTKLKENGVWVGAIQTTTRASLKYPKEIVNTYFDLGFDSIFIRPLTPLGKATKNWEKIGYTPEEFLSFYETAFEEIIQINQRQKFFKEEHASILLEKIEGHFVNYMELRSPCGAAIGQVAYYADGNIFTCDEGRMLHEMGNHAFCIGNVNNDTYKSLISGSKCRAICSSSILETIPSCCDCVYQPYCGTCPVVNFATYGDIIEKEPRGYKCKLYAGMLDNIFSILLGEDKTKLQILHSWSN